MDADPPEDANSSSCPSDRSVTLPATPLVVAGPRGVATLSPDGELQLISPRAARGWIAQATPIVCHGSALARRLGIDPFPAYDVLELLAFVRPASFCLPTVRGLAATTGLNLPVTLEDQVQAMGAAAAALIGELATPHYPSRAATAAVAARLAEHGWPWASLVLRALGVPADKGGLDPWARLDEWTDQPPESAPSHFDVSPDEARRRLADLLGADAEPRPEQADYASAVSFAFAPADAAGEPHVVLAEAGTGVGKTLGYIAPASIWAQKNGGAVWLSTYTKNLQRQINRELDRLFSDPAEKARRVVVRKGRENYLCLLNFEEAVGRLATSAQPDGIALGLMARWVGATQDGDMVGGDFPAWLVDLLGRRRTFGLADQRGECIHSACPHYRKCFVERAVRRARQADIVIANHALVMVHAATGHDETFKPTRYVFDEGHHVFAAADSAFSGHLTGIEAHELRRWLLGMEGGRRGRARGLKRRLDGLLDDQDAADMLAQVLSAARALPADGWWSRVNERQPRGTAEAFLCAVHQQASARADDDGAYAIETETRPPIDGLIPAAQRLASSLNGLATPMAKLESLLLSRLDNEADNLDSATRVRIEAVARSLWRRRVHLVEPWRHMLKALDADPDDAYSDWFSIDRVGRQRDVGLHRHWVDPTVPFAEAVLSHAHGVVVTSATLRDGTGDPEHDWRAAEIRVGTRHLARPAIRAALPSPFDYAAATRVMVVTDVNRNDPDQVAAAYRVLFGAANGGALGLFTAIRRLRAAYERIAVPLDAAGLTVMAQHVDGLDPGTLVDVFRAEPSTCLLGTDALRDGVDVPGEALRLIVFDRVPWPRPDILHRARRAALGGRAYDDMLVRFKLRQAFGRLVRRADDFGVFVMLDPATPTRLFGAFPDRVAPHRVGLAEAVEITRTFVADHMAARA